MAFSILRRENYLGKGFREKILRVVGGGEGGLENTKNQKEPF